MRSQFDFKSGYIVLNLTSYAEIPLRTNVASHKYRVQTTSCVDIRLGLNWVIILVLNLTTISLPGTLNDSK